MNIKAHYKNYLWAAATAAIASIGVTPDALAQSYRELTPDSCNQAIPLPTYHGQLTTIDLSQANQTITYIGLSDRSHHVLNTDVPLESGEAQAVFILPIQKINFPGATTSVTPNLVIRAKNESGQLATCNFLISTHQAKMATLGIKFVPPAPKPVANIAPQPGTFKVSGDRVATADDLEAGLDIAIAKGFTTPEDPINQKIQRLAFQLRNGSELEEALTQSQTPPEIAQKVAEINLDLPPKKLSRPYINPQTKNTLEVTERIFLAQDILLRLHSAVDKGEIKRNSNEYQDIKQAIADIRRGKNPQQAGIDNKLSPRWQSWLSKNS